ncbi:MAG: hypothetical protein A2X94_06380 [Bdellovibrionales bacterium GWB1_55_8]|nr:MAG: hypothetical protein A2X94_06380 [Bdellovibrionales bacterium GWB1_55_8]
MAEKAKAPIIIRKKVMAGGHGAHGGAWKVAFADFMTALMCFFLVMWLMGSDDETRAAIAHYFNNPNTPYKQGRDPQSEMARPLGDRKDSGDAILKGLNGLNPDDLIQNPVRPVNDQLETHKELADLAAELLEGHIYGLDVNLDYVKFSVPEDLIFAPGSSRLKAEAGKNLDKLGQLFRGYRGYITIEGHTDNPPSSLGGFANAYEYSLARAVAVMNYFIEHHWAREDRLMPLGSGGRRSVSPNTTREGRKMNRRIEFTLSYQKSR